MPEQDQERRRRVNFFCDAPGTEDENLPEEDGPEWQAIRMCDNCVSFLDDEDHGRYECLNKETGVGRHLDFDCICDLFQSRYMQNEVAPNE